ncbi:MAG TPA: hypothetical protein PKV73_06280 [Agriterribacter sp.]|nr:hypothetical protein [Agriterribacter sp.]
MNTKIIRQRVMLYFLSSIVLLVHIPVVGQIAGESEPALCTVQFNSPQEASNSTTKDVAKTYHLKPNQMGAFGPVYNIHPMQKLTIEMTYPKGKSGQIIVIETLDGGLLGNKKIVQALSLNNQYKIVFNFLSGEDPGLYRISLRKDMDVKEVQFWVGPQPAR